MSLKQQLSLTFALGLPTILANISAIVMQFIDAAMVGQLGARASASIGLVASTTWLVGGLASAAVHGFSVQVAHAVGAGDGERSRSILRQAICANLIFSVFLAVICVLLSGPLPALLGAEETIRKDAAMYLRIYSIFLPVLSIQFLMAQMLQCSGDMKTPGIVSVLECALNVVFNYLLIFPAHAVKLWGMTVRVPGAGLGVAGAALGTLIARLFEATMILGYLFGVDKKIRFRLRDLFMKTGSLIGEYIRISIPVLVSDAILAIGNNSVAMVIGHLGAAFVAANAITSVTQQLSTVVIQGVSQAGAIVTGQTLGLGDRHKTMDQGWMFFGLGLALGAVSAAFIMAVSHPIISTYKVSEETVKIAEQLMAAISIIIIFRATNSIMTKGVLRGGGDTKMLMVADNIFLWVLAIPFGILAGFVFHWSAFWIYIALKSDDIVKTFWCLGRLKSEKWIKKISTGRK